MSTQENLKALKTALSMRAPYVSGTCSIPADDFVLYYGPEGDARRINLSKATPEHLKALADSCEAATFGVDQKDVLDESYRKAGKMDVSNFASKFSLARTGIMEHVRSQLVEDAQVRVELYKLNVYGKDSFFKAHKDTPRGENMFGSLVVVFPSTHVGGALLLRHEGEEWSFDAAKELSQCTDPSGSVGFVAFYSDVEHEVAVVESGYRVTLTYNLYHASDPTPPQSLGISPDVYPGEAEFKAAFQKLLIDTAVLPEGGLLGFGLQHEYAVNERTRISDLLCTLKGGDAVVRRVCEQLSLMAELKFIYKDDYHGGPSTLSSRFIDLSRSGEVEDLKDELRSRGGTNICDQTPGHIWEDREYEEDVAVYWLNEPTDTTRMEGMFLAHGNEASLEHYYANICLLVKVGRPGENRVLNVKG